MPTTESITRWLRHDCCGRPMSSALVSLLSTLDGVAWSTCGLVPNLVLSSQLLFGEASGGGLSAHLPLALASLFLSAAGIACDLALSASCCAAEEGGGPRCLFGAFKHVHPAASVLSAGVSVAAAALHGSLRKERLSGCRSSPAAGNEDDDFCTGTEPFDSMSAAATGAATAAALLLFPRQTTLGT